MSLFPARERLVSDIPAGDGKIVTFLQCSVPDSLEIDVVGHVHFGYSNFHILNQQVGGLVLLVPEKPSCWFSPLERLKFIKNFI